MINVLETYTVKKKNYVPSFFICKNLNQFVYALSVNHNFSVHDLSLEAASLCSSVGVTNKLKN